MTDSEIDRLAFRIVRDLFTNGSKQRAVRLVLELSPSDIPSRTRTGGGWSEIGARDRVFVKLRRAIPRT